MAEPQEQSPENPLRFSLVYYTVLMAVMFSLQGLFFSDPDAKQIPYSEFLDQVDADRVAHVAITEEHIFGVLKPPKGSGSQEGTGSSSSFWGRSESEKRSWQGNQWGWRGGNGRGGKRWW